MTGNDLKEIAPGAVPLVINGTGGFTNKGTVHVESGATLEVLNSAYVQKSGRTLVDLGGTLNASSVQEKGGSLQVDGSLDPLSIHVFASATLSGDGTIDGNILNDGLVVLGDSISEPGTLSVNGNFNQDAGGVLDEGIGSLDHGELSVAGNVGLGGTLDIALLGGFTPTNGEHFELTGIHRNRERGLLLHHRL